MFDIPGKITIGIRFTLSSAESEKGSFKLRYVAENSKDKKKPLGIVLNLHKQFDSYGQPERAVERALAQAVDEYIIPKAVARLDDAVVAKQGVVDDDCYPDNGESSGAFQFERGDRKEVIKVEKAKAKLEKAAATLSEILGSLQKHVDYELEAALREIAKSDAHGHVTEDLERLREHVRFVLGEVLGVRAI